MTEAKRTFHRAIAAAHLAYVTALERPLTGAWKLVFDSHFEDASKWTDRYWWHRHWWNDNGSTNEGNNELQWYSPDHAIFTKDGIRLRATDHEIVNKTKGKRFGYQSGMASTGPVGPVPQLSGFEFQYGFIEASIRFAPGKGLLSAFWLLPSSRESRPELDIVEVLGESPRIAHVNYHWTDQNGAHQQTGKTFAHDDLTQAPHVYGLLWEPDKLVWYVDGFEVTRIEAQPIPSEPMYILLTHAVGGNWPGPPDDSTRFPADMLVDYVRVWQLP